MGNLKQSFIKGTFYTGISKYTILAVNILVTAILARLLPPEDFGIIALTVVVTCFFDILANAGIGPAIIQNKEIKDIELPHLFRFSCCLAVVLVLFFDVIIYPISQFYKEPRLVNILLLTSLQLFFNTLNVIPQSLLLKGRRFKLVARISIISTIICGTLSVIAALAGLGIYSLIISPIGISLLTFCQTIYHNKTLISFDTFRIDKNSIIKILNFSVYQFLFNCVNFLSRNLDKILMGRYIGMQPLGYYEKSYRLMTLPISTLTNVFTPTIQPILSEYQNDPVTIKNVYNKISTYLFFGGTVLAPFLFFTAKEIIIIVFGDQWIPAISIFKCLAISVPFQMVDSLSGSILQASNNIKILFRSGVLCSLVNLIILIISIIVFDNITYISLCIAISFIINYYISVFCICKYATGQRFILYIRDSFKYILSMATLSLILLLIPTSINNVIVLIFIKVSTTVVYTFCACLYFHFFSFSMIKNYLHK